MNAHIVLAHPEEKSFNGHLTRLAEESLIEDGWKVTCSNLYSMGFDPCEKAEHYQNRLKQDRFNIQAEQRYASEQGIIPDEIKRELDLLDALDLLILQYPMWWHMPPAILKGWFDRVFLYGKAYTSKKRFENGRFKGKKAMLSVTVGTSKETYEYNGRSGDIDLMLWPVNFSLAFVGFSILEPFISYGVESALSYSNNDEVRKRLIDIESDYKKRICNIEDIREVPFNKMSHWGNDGKITPESPVYSPYIRHNKKLNLY